VIREQLEMERASYRITELEETLTGKQTALDQALADNEELQAQIALLTSLDSVVSYSSLCRTVCVEYAGLLTILANIIADINTDTFC